MNIFEQSMHDVFFVTDREIEMQGAVFMPHNPQQGFPPPSSTIGEYYLSDCVKVCMGH